MKKRIYLSPPHLTGEELDYLRDALASNWIAPAGPHIELFEAELAALLNVAGAVTANSGTSAIHLGLLAMGVSKGDEVLTSTLTFCASVNPIIYCGATPVFVDSERRSWNMDPSLLERAIDERIKATGKTPKAIVLVHLYGMPSQLSSILPIARRYGIPVLEDAAEALGSSYDGHALGTFDLAGVISFNGNKIITTSSGGALLSNDQSIIERARYLRQEAKEPLPYYEHREVGYNYRFSNVLAALGRAQLKVLNERVARKREIFTQYNNALQQRGEFIFQLEDQLSYSNRWLTAVVFPSTAVREKVRLALERGNIESRPVWKPMHLQPAYRSCPSCLNGISDFLFMNGLCLPSGTAMTDQDIGHVIEVIRQHAF